MMQILRCRPSTTYLTASIVFLAQVLSESPVRADAAPDWYPQAGAIGPIAETSIALEKLRLEFDDRDRLVVNSTYNFQNTGSHTEVMTIAFPVCELNYETTVEGDAICGIPRNEIVVEVDGQKQDAVPHASADTVNETADVSMRFQLRFEPGERKKVLLSYPILAAENGDCAYHFFYASYRFDLSETAKWAGDIDEIQIVVKLPYPARPDSASVAFKPARSNEGNFRPEGNTYTWKARGYQSQYELLYMRLLYPNEHQRRARLLAQLDKKPGDLATQFALASSLLLGDEQSYKEVMEPALKQKFPAWNAISRDSFMSRYSELLNNFSGCGDPYCDGDESFCADLNAYLAVHRLACNEEPACLRHVEDIRVCCPVVTTDVENEPDGVEVPAADTGTGQSETSDSSVRGAESDTGLEAVVTETVAEHLPETTAPSTTHPAITSSVVEESASFETSEVVILIAVVFLVLGVVVVLRIRERD